MEDLQEWNRFLEVIGDEDRRAVVRQVLSHQPELPEVVQMVRYELEAVYGTLEEAWLVGREKVAELGID